MLPFLCRRGRDQGREEGVFVIFNRSACACSRRRASAPGDGQDLTKEEQEHVTAALRFLAIRFGQIKLLAEALRCDARTICKVTGGKDAISPTMAFRLARLASAGVDDVLAGRWPAPGTCPHCGRGP